MSDFAQSVKQQADIVRVVGEYITLKKSGAQNYSGLCPFHGEKTPSFSVHVTRQFYHCFGCGVSGDVFKFVQEIEKVSFPEAVKIVAQKCGIALPKREFSSPEEAAESRLRGRLLELYEQATLWFEEQLKSPEGARAREYLTGRGLKPETIAKFRIGYAPDGFGGQQLLKAFFLRVFRLLCHVLAPDEITTEGGRPGQGEGQGREQRDTHGQGECAEKGSSHAGDGNKRQKHDDGRYG